MSSYRSLKLVNIFALCTVLLWSGVSQAGTLPDFTKLVESNSPAVVNISTTQKLAKSRQRQFNMPDIPEGSPFGDLFRHFFGEGEGMPEQFNAKSLGSGFIVSKEGYVLTNNHVVKDANEIIVRLSDRRELVAEIVGTDEKSDIALLKIDAKESLPVVKIGDSKSLKVGEWVLAIGSPFGFDHTVTAGIVSAKGRALPRENYVPFIQTDVAINPGNSGGPLFNLKGEVIGINSQIYSRTGGFMGLSFAIPINVAIDVMEQLKDTGHVKRGWLGILIQDVTRELAESFGMDKPHGALVAKVLADSPAEEAGLQVGDVVVEFNGNPIGSSSNLPPVVGRTPIGKAVKSLIIRNGKRQTVWVKVGELPEDEKLKLGRHDPETQSGGRLGVVVANIEKPDRERLNLGATGGVLVKQIKRGVATKAGIKLGDAILRIGTADVKDMRHFSELTKKLPEGRSISVLVQRRSGPIFLALKLDKE